MKLHGKVALVSGSGRGIGRAVAEKLAAEGARLVVNDLDADPAQEAAEAIRATGAEVAVCAGGVWGNAGQVNYAAGKAGITGVTRALAREWGRYRVNVNAVAFGLISTRMTQPVSAAGAQIDVAGRALPVGIPEQAVRAIEAQIPLGRGGTPEEAAGAVYLLHSRKRLRERPGAAGHGRAVARCLALAPQGADGSQFCDTDKHEETAPCDSPCRRWPPWGVPPCGRSGPMPGARMRAAAPS